MIVFSDFDNTLYLHSDEHEFLYNLEAIKKFRKRGNLFCLATGRNQASLGRAWADYSNYLDYIIFDNGAVCVNRQGETVFQETIPLDIVKTITDKITKKFGNEVEFVVYIMTIKNGQSRIRTLLKFAAGRPVPRSPSR